MIPIGQDAHLFRNAIVARLLRPIGVLVAVVVALAIGVVWWACAVADDAALVQQRDRLAVGLEQELDGARSRLLALVRRSDDADSFQRQLEATPETELRDGAEFDGLAMLPESRRSPLVRFTEAEPDSSFRVAMRSLVDTAMREASVADTDAQARPHSQVKMVGGEPVTVSVLTGAEIWPDDGDRQARSIIVGVNRWTDRKLALFGELHGVKGLAFSDTPGTSGSLELGDPDGRPLTHLIWNQPREGLMGAHIARLAALQIGIALLLFGAVALYVRRVSKDLAHKEVLARDLLGRDPLSGLANRLLFNEALDRELTKLDRHGGGLAVMFIDLDRFKDVNDTYGHQAGDDLIQLVAKRILEVVGEADTFARFGGDEFAVIQPGIASVAEVEVLTRRILDLLTRPFALSDSLVTVGASIGVALAPEHGRDRESLMRLADAALYQAKSEGRNRSCFYQTHMDEALRMRKLVEDDLRRAIRDDELALFYQPLFSSDGETIVGLEALVRWPHPVRGLIAPSDFIPIAEERGLIIPLGSWVLKRACQDGRRWPGLRIAVNVSAIQFRHKDYVESVVDTLQETGFDPSRLELELTEGVVVGDADAAEAAMIELRALGVHLALDDFGTGYSSLIYLRRFAFDKIKIDRSFLESMEATGESAILVHSIVHLGRALGLTVTAEGVETREQHRFLQALGCHQLQGYLFSKPVPAAEIDRLLNIQPSQAGSSASAA